MEHYQTLGIDKTANPDEIKRAYRKLASRHHPDKGGDTATFQKIQTAYDTLSDPQKREEYDNPRPQFGGFDFHRQGFAGFEDLFAQFNRNRPRIYTCAVFVSLEAVARGSRETVYINTDAGSKMFQIDVPRGVEDGQTVRYEGIMSDGFLQVQYRIHKHPRFERRGLDLYSEYQISVFDLILGTKILVDTIYGKTLEVNIPPRTKAKATLRLANHGLDTQRGTGDQYVLISAIIPDKISDDLLVALENERNIKQH